MRAVSITCWSGDAGDSRTACTGTLRGTDAVCTPASTAALVGAAGSSSCPGPLKPCPSCPVSCLACPAFFWAEALQAWMLLLSLVCTAIAFSVQIFASCHAEFVASPVPDSEALQRRGARCRHLIGRIALIRTVLGTNAITARTVWMKTLSYMYVGGGRMTAHLLLAGGDWDLGERCRLASLNSAAPLPAAFCWCSGFSASVRLPSLSLLSGVASARVPKTFEATRESWQAKRFSARSRHQYWF